MIIDIIAALLVAYGFYTGYNRGIIKTVFNTLSIFIGILAALKLSPIVIGILEKLITTAPAIVFILGFVITFILVLGLIRFAGKKLEQMFKTVHINFVNKLLGGALMSIFFLVIFSYGIWGLSELRVLNQSTSEKSIAYPIVKPIPQASKKIFIKLKPVFEGFWDKVVVTMDKIKEKGEGIPDKIE